METNKLMEILGAKESFDVPNKIMENLLSENREEFLNNLLGIYGNIFVDEFNGYYQTYFSERTKLKQDYTPNEVGKLLSMIIGRTPVIRDVCAGTGTLAINYWSDNPETFIICEEFSNRVIPFLLANLALRNVNGIVYHGDTLTKEYQKIYKLDKTETFSKIEEVEEIEEKKGAVISNPPYSLGWFPQNDERFEGYGLAPKSKADYAFVLHGLSNLDDNQKQICILPHGILFRGASEREIRKKLIDENLIDCVVGLPSNLFVNTQIPTCLLILNKKKTTNDILFIDSSKEFKKEGKMNVLLDEHISKIVGTYQNRAKVNRYSSVANINDLEENDYNLNIPRYVDNYEEKESIDIVSVTKELLDLAQESTDSLLGIGKALNELTANTPQADEQLKEVQKMFNQFAKKYKKDHKAEQGSLW